jgi:hypothetical protein
VFGNGFLKSAIKKKIRPKDSTLDIGLGCDTIYKMFQTISQQKYLLLELFNSRFQDLMFRDINNRLRP